MTEQEMLRRSMANLLCEELDKEWRKLADLQDAEIERLKEFFTRAELEVE